MPCMPNPTRRVPADVRRVLPPLDPQCTDNAPESDGSGNRAPMWAGAPGDGSGGVCGFLEGEERRIAYRMTDWRFSFEGGE
jgi:hypothetical protein